MKLQGNHIYLRLLEPSDADGNYPNWLNDPDVCRYNSHGEALYTHEMAKAYITSISNNPSIQVFAICETQNNQHIGNISLQQISAKNRSAEFAILIGKVSIYGNGIGFETSSLLFDYGFKTLKLHRIYCGTHSENIGMQKLALKLGMAQEGLRRNALFKNGQFADIVEYGILYDDYIKGQQ
jgi:ribosomal-protein-alanine N-acetyltransferase